MAKIKRLIKNDLFPIIVGLIFFVPALILHLLSLDKAALPLFIAALIISGYRVFFDALKGILRRDFLDEKFLMSIASAGAMIIGEYTEGVAVMLFFLVGEYFEHRAVRKSRNAIRAIMDINPDTACVLKDGKEITVDADEVEVGDTVIVRTGERVPVDGQIISGMSNIDTSAMTGESIPRSVTVGDTLESGVILMDGVLTLRALRVSEESSASRVLALVEEAGERKSKEENFITKFSRCYTPTVVILALLMATLPPLLSLISWQDALYRSLTFLIISCPCALVISVPMAFFCGIGAAASCGILFKGGNIFSFVANADTVALDKTGTLTDGKFSVSSVIAFAEDEDRILRLAASAEYGSNHPIAAAIKASCSNAEKPDEIKEISGMGVVADIENDEVAVGNKALLEMLGISIKSDASGVLVALNGEHIGTLTLSDKMKSEAPVAIAALRKLGVKQSVILSGDRREKVEEIRTKVGAEFAYSELSPSDKYARLEGLIEKSRGGVMFVGDGINDAPSIARADVGIAMGALGQDSAVEAADLVIMSDNLTRIPEAVRIAKRTLAVAKENIAFAIGIKLLVMLLGAFNVANMWFAVFADVGVCVLAILNSMRLLAYGRGKK